MFFNVLVHYLANIIEIDLKQMNETVILLEFANSDYHTFNLLAIKRKLTICNKLLYKDNLI